MIANLYAGHLVQVKLIQKECREIAKEIGAKIRKSRGSITLTLADGTKLTFYGFIPMYNFLKVHVNEGGQRDAKF